MRHPAAFAMVLLVPLMMAGCRTTQDDPSEGYARAGDPVPAGQPVEMSGGSVDEPVFAEGGVAGYDMEKDPGRYRVRRADTLNIEIFKEPDISGAFKVNEDGAIKHPLLGKVVVSGRTVSEIEEDLHRLLAADYLVNPRVSVTVSRSADRPVMVFGEVRSPGTYTVPAGERLTLLQAIARAGGFTDIAARDRVRIVRVENGRERTIKVRVSDLFRGRDGITDIDLKPGDVITVPETLF